MSKSSNIEESAINASQETCNNIQTPPVMATSWPALSLSLSSKEALSPEVHLASNQATNSCNVVEIENTMVGSVSTEVAESDCEGSSTMIPENSVSLSSGPEPQNAVPLSHSRPAQIHTSRHSKRRNFHNQGGRNRGHEFQNQNYMNRNWDFDQAFNPRVSFQHHQAHGLGNGPAWFPSFNNSNFDPAFDLHPPPLHGSATGSDGFLGWNFHPAFDGRVVNFQNQAHGLANGFVGPPPLPHPYPVPHFNAPPLLPPPVPGHVHPFEHYGNPYFPAPVPALHAGVVRGPFNEISLCNEIQKQIEFYFSDQNLLTDDYLRRQMDEQGWVHVGLIAGFSRIKAMTNNTELILRAVRPSQVVEVQVMSLHTKLNDLSLRDESVPKVFMFQNFHYGLLNLVLLNLVIMVML
ncbi:hypothetical protein HHK36_007773 [Tetracentron sinense]|uniref:HTH La-type RNA-binding domain-containing protein n=1 Tax=Tetracentron sinense TaxID=13715 RepID=A0A834ZL47_TETSI|nr:hypothetical protein HHK36_007773 [Tetracentron sinense]